MKKIILLLLSAVMLLCAFGCSEGKTPESTEPTRERPIVLPSEIMTEIESSATALIEHSVYSSEGTTLAAGQINYYYGSLDGDFSEMVDSYALLTAVGSDVCEIGIFRLKDAADSGKMLDALNARQAVVEEAHKNYVPENYERAKGAVVGSLDGYVYYIMTDENAALESIIKTELEATRDDA